MSTFAETIGQTKTGDFRQQNRRAGFDPQGDLLLGAVHAESAGPLNLRSLSPFQRALLIIDGTVTKFLEAYTLEPIEIIKVSQIARTLPVDYGWLEASQGTDILVRQVLLQGRYSSAIHAYGLSLIAPDHIQVQAVKDDLALTGKGLGQVLRDHRIETFREVLWYGSERVGDLPADFHGLADGEFISRTYRIIAWGKPLMVIHEKFPRDFDRRSDHGACNGY